MKRWILIIALSIFTILVGSGCQNIKTLEIDFGGLDVEYYPTHPSQEEKSIFDFSGTAQDLVVPADWDGPLLMPMKRNK
tara:strand:+ start:186 stop:422 length:237 start_codon:yes stop_codon:yes gene_type:complete